MKKQNPFLVVLLFAVTFLFFSKSEAVAEINAKLIYKTYCVQCHGLSGNGKGVNTPFMNVQPRDHSSAKEMEPLTNVQIKKAITLGGLAVSKSVEMPPWGHTLTEAEIDSLVKYLRELCKCKGRN